MNKIYLVEYFDRSTEMPEQGIPTEDAVAIGYFTSKKQISNAIEQCIAAKLPKENLRTVEYPLCFGNAQTDVYVLIYEYYYEESDGRSEYYYVWPPCLTKEDSEDLRRRLLELPEYRKTEEKHFYESADGFRIRQFEINQVCPVTAFE